MKILPSCSHVSTIVWLHHMNFSKVFGKKARWKLHKDAMCYFEQILKKAPHKIAVIWPLVSHLINHSSKISKTCWALLEKKGQTHKQGSSMSANTWIEQCWLTSKDSSTLCKHWMPSKELTKSDG